MLLLRRRRSSVAHAVGLCPSPWVLLALGLGRLSVTHVLLLLLLLLAVERLGRLAPHVAPGAVAVPKALPWLVRRKCVRCLSLWCTRPASSSHAASLVARRIVAVLLLLGVGEHPFGCPAARSVLLAGKAW